MRALRMEWWTSSVKDMIILVKLLVRDLVFNVISAYAPQIGLNESIKMQFWDELDALVSSVLVFENLFIGGDLNGHVGSTRVETKKGRVF
jgi:hypothetical protein